MAWTEDPLPLPPSAVLVVTPALLHCHIARCSCCPRYGRGNDNQGGDGVAKGGADNDYDEDDPSAFSPGGARAVGERGDGCVQGRIVQWEECDVSRRCKGGRPCNLHNIDIGQCKNTHRERRVRSGERGGATRKKGSKSYIRLQKRILDA